MTNRDVPCVERFRLSDVDPATGRSFSETRFGELPELVMDLVLHMGVSPERWNALVERGEALEVPYLDGWHTVTRAWDWRQAPKSVGWPGAARLTLKRQGAGVAA